mgnify:CR=1 FL=1
MSASDPFRCSARASPTPRSEAPCARVPQHAGLLLLEGHRGDLPVEGIQHVEQVALVGQASGSTSAVSRRNEQRERREREAEAAHGDLRKRPAVR